MTINRVNLNSARRRIRLLGDLIPDHKGLRVCLDARYGLQTTAAGKVLSWENRGPDPVARYATPPTEAAQPTLVGASQNSQPAVVFDGANTYMKVDRFAAVIAQPMTVFFACKTPASSGSYANMYDGRSSSTRQAVYKSNLDRVTMYAGAEIFYSPATLAAPTVFSSLWNQANSVIFENGVYKNTTGASPGTHSVDGYSLGSNHSTGAKGDMDMYVMLSFDRLLGDEERQQIEANIGALWGISVVKDVAP